jgi:hypothetical protein
MDLYESLFGGDDAQKNLTDLEKALDKIGYEIVDNEIKKKTA